MATILECINTDFDPKLGNPFAAFDPLIKSFFTMLPELVSLDLPVKLTKTPLPQIIFDAFTSSLPKDLPSFEIPGFGKFKGKDISVNLFSLGTPDTGLIGFITGLFNIALGIPKLFIDFDEKGKPPVPKLKIPPIPADLGDIILELVNASLPLKGFIKLKALPEGFDVKITNCIVKSILGIIP